MTAATRRQFLRRSIATCGQAAATTQLPAAEVTPGATPDVKLRISVLSYSFRGLLSQGKMDVFGYLESCEYRYGLDAADLWNDFLSTLSAVVILVCCESQHVGCPLGDLHVVCQSQ